jgi:hypothetical protein
MNGENIEKCLMIGMFGDERFYPSNYILIQLNPHTTLVDDREVMESS